MEKGVLCDQEKNGKLRMIIVCCRSNKRFKRAPRGEQIGKGPKELNSKQQREPWTGEKGEGPKNKNENPRASADRGGEKREREAKLSEPEQQLCGGEQSGSEPTEEKKTKQ